MWIYWINPLAYALEALMATELNGRTFPCVGQNLIPAGASYTTEFASCAGVPGAFGTAVDGTAYLATLSWKHSHVWRNFGGSSSVFNYELR